MINRVEKNKKRSFAINSSIDNTNQLPSIDFSKIKIGAKSLEDAVLSFGSLKKVNPSLADKNAVLDAIDKYDLEKMREISNFFYRTSGIYSRLCRYMAYLYRYDWMLIPRVINEEKNVNNKLIKDFKKVLTVLDNFEVKRFLGSIALKVIQNGCYYGYLIKNNDKISIQELPAKYCRTRYSVNRKPAIEFNMKFFDSQFRNVEQRLKILNLFPSEFKKGYLLYKEGKLVPDFPGDSSGWYLLDINSTIKFNINGEDYPLFISVIPAILDLDAAQELDRKKMAQQLLKIIIQKMPIDKNGDLVFDVDEAQALHNNAVQMLSKAIGLDVLTTFADVDVADMSDRNTNSSIDELMKIERTVYNESGTAQNLFNTDGNIALQKSILNDEASIYDLLLQFESFLNELIESYNNKKYIFKVQLLPTTIYNYQDLAKIYKEQTQMGYSKFLPQIALGQSQSAILASAYFENEILDLVNILIPTMNSNTMNSAAVGKAGGQAKSSDTTKKTTPGESSDQVGRKEKADDEKSEKTMKNIESMG